MGRGQGGSQGRSRGSQGRRWCEWTPDSTPRWSTNRRRDSHGPNPMKAPADCCGGCFYNNHFRTSHCTTPRHCRSCRIYPACWAAFVLQDEYHNLGCFFPCHKNSFCTTPLCQCCCCQRICVHPLHPRRR